MHVVQNNVCILVSVHKKTQGTFMYFLLLFLFAVEKASCPGNCCEQGSHFKSTLWWLGLAYCQLYHFISVADINFS